VSWFSSSSRLFNQSNGLHYPNSIYAPLERVLLRPISDVQSRIDDLTTKFTGRYVVGVQLRRQILQLANDGFNITESLRKQLWEHAEKIAMAGIVASNNPLQQPLFFVASDHDEGYESARQYFGDQRLIMNNNDKVWVWRDRLHADHTDGWKKDVRAEQDAVVVNWVLSKVDHLMYTGVSSYGHIAAARGSWEHGMLVSEFSLLNTRGNLHHPDAVSWLVRERVTRDPPCNFWSRTPPNECRAEMTSYQWTWLPVSTFLSSQSSRSHSLPSSLTSVVDSIK
jgi:hypothetical protein